MASEAAPSRRALGLAVALVAVALLLWSEPALAQQEFMELMVKKIQTFLVIAVGAVAVFQVFFVWLTARVLGVEESLIRAGLAVIVGGLMTVVAAIPAAFALSAFPPALQGVLFSVVGAAAGGLGIKLLLRTEFLRAMAIYLLATTANTLALALVLIVVY